MFAKCPRWMLVAALICAAAGCGQVDEEQEAMNMALRYAELPGLRATTHKGLQEELARLVDERATPKLLDEARAQAAADAYRLTTVAVESGDELQAAGPTSTVIDWDEFFSPRKLDDVVERIDKVYPAGPLKFHPAVLRGAIELRTQYEPQRQRFRRLLAMQLPQQWKHSQGLLAETSDATVLRICARLEGLAAAEALADNRPETALACVRQMIAAAERLAAESRVLSRVVAVDIRDDALRALAAVAVHPQTGAGLHREISDLIDAQLAQWPSDRLAWIGDRAAGLHTYEMVRDGQLMLLLTGAEKVRFKRLGVYDNLEQFVAANIDGDEMYYLSAMRRLIAVCDKPYYRRVELLEGIRNELLDLHATAQYPVVADTILLFDFEAGFRLQALDRARLEAWRLALHAATSSTLPEPGVNPLTGQPFEIAIENSFVVVGAIDPETGEQLVIPRRQGS